MVSDGDNIAVWFSCGAASAVAAKLTVLKYGGRAAVRILNTPIAEEHEDNRRFLRDVSDWVGAPIEIVTNPKYPTNSCVDVWAREKYMSGVSGAKCTVELKKRARQLWEKDNLADWHVLGFTADESARALRFRLTERDNLLAVLVDEKVTKSDCFAIIRDAGIELPEIYRLGYPNANCIGCVKATSATYWNHVRRQHPDVFAARAEQSRDLGVRLARHKGARVFLDELPPTAKGRPMKNMDFECGIFCEEK